MKPVMTLINSSTRRLLGLCLLALVPGTAFGAGEVMVYPTRVVFDSERRSAHVEIINAGRETTTYRIAFENKRMTEAGHFETLPPGTPGLYAADFVQFSPRQIVLAPGAAQIVRLYLRKPANLAAGEYRSHLAIKAVPPAAPARSAQPDDKGLRIELTPVFGVTIPVIVRQGTLSARAEIANLAFRNSRDKEPGLLRVQLHRTGNRSVYGDVTVHFAAARGGERVIGRAAGVAVYTPNTTRVLFVPLAESPEKLRGGALRVTYRTRPDEGGATLAEIKVPVR